MATKKIILVGDINGHFDAIFDKLNRIHASKGHSFTAAFCVGNFFGADASQLQPYIEGKKQITLPTYFILADDQDTSLLDNLDQNGGGELCTNLTFLGRSGIQNVHGMRVCFLSGVYDSNRFNAINNASDDTMTMDKSSTTKFASHYTQSDIHAIAEQQRGGGGIDLLLTSEWPRNFHLGIAHGIDTTSTIPLNLSLAAFAALGVSPIGNKLAIQCAPQYHFCGMHDIFFRLTPYKTNDNSNSTHATRFVALGKHESANGAKHIYATNLSPLQSSPSSSASAKDNTFTKCPYLLPFKSVDKHEPGTLKRVVHKRSFNEMMQDQTAGHSHSSHQQNHHFVIPNNVPPANYVCHRCGVPGHYINECTRNTARTSSSSSSSAQSSSASHAHAHRPPLTTGVGRDDYFFEKFAGRRAMRRAKKSGGECWFCLGSSKVESHLIVSIAEHAYMAVAKGQLVRGDHVLLIPVHHLPNSMRFSGAIVSEIERYLRCLSKLYEKDNKALIVMDRYLQSITYSQHCYLEVIAVDKEKCKSLKEALLKQASKLDLTFEVSSMSDDAADKHNVSSFGYLILHNYGTREKYTHAVQSGMKKIPLNFLRKVVAIHLDIPERAEWSVCVDSITQESNQTNRIKDKFKPFDWTQRQTQTQTTTTTTTEATAIVKT